MATVLKVGLPPVVPGISSLSTTSKSKHAYRQGSNTPPPENTVNKKPEPQLLLLPASHSHMLRLPGGQGISHYAKREFVSYKWDIR